MRQGIYKEQNGVRNFDVQKIIGKCFNNVWFTNTRNIRYRLLKGARNCKKSYNMSYEAIFKIISDPQKNILFVRAQDVDNRDSTFAAVCRAISDLGLEDFFKSTTQPLRITYLPTGQTILFRGMSNPTSLNSLTFATGFLTDCYIEEAYELSSYDAFVKLDQSIRAGMAYDQDGNLVEQDIPQQITMMFNAWSDVTWLYTEFFKGRLEDDPEYLETHKYADLRDDNFVGPGGTGLYLGIYTYKANEFRNRKQVDVAAAEMREKNYDYYKTLFLGCWGAAGDTTYPEFKQDNVISNEQACAFKYTNFAIGIDTGLSAGDGSKIRVLKNEDGSKKVKAATVMTLGAVVGNYEKLVALDEYYHSNDPTYWEYNTDSKEELNINQQAARIVLTIFDWIEKYRDARADFVKGDVLFKGIINIYIDSADIGFRQVLEIKAREMKLFNARFYGSTKTPIQGRVDFERLMMSYKDLLVSECCPNLTREFKASRRDPKTGLRENINDHAINSYEYSVSPFRNNFARWKNNFKD